MASIRWNPWNIDRLFEDDWELPTIPGISRLVGQGLNLYETESEIVAEIAIPGIPEDQINVTIDDNGVVRVTGTYEDEEEQKQRRRYFMSTLSTSFNYSFRLPQGMITDQQPEVELDKGILRMRFTKQPKQAPQRIKITNKNQKETKNSKPSEEIDNTQS